MFIYFLGKKILFIPIQRYIYIRRPENKLVSNALFTRFNKEKLEWVELEIP